MKRQILGLLGVATMAAVQATSTPCADSTVVDIISTNMTLGIALMANATAQIQASCNGTAISCSVDEADVVSILSDLYSGAAKLDKAVQEYVSITGLNPSVCLSTSACNCTAIPADWNAIETFYNNTYLPKWNEFAHGTASNCTATAEELYFQASQIYCDSFKIVGNYEACRYECGLPCCDDAFALQFNSTFNAAVALIDEASNANEASCTSGSYSCSASNTNQTLKDLEAANVLLSEVLDQMENLYGVQFAAPPPCSNTAGTCSCNGNLNIYNNTDSLILDFYRELQKFVSGSSENCALSLFFLFRHVSNIQCNIQQLILNYNKCLKECPCPPTPIQTGISESMTQALAYISNVGTAYNAQCPGRFNCSSTDLTLARQDLTQAIASYDFAIGNYTEFIQDTNFNTSCSLLKAECGCRVISDGLEVLNATYYLDYEPEWIKFIIGYTADCTAQATLLRNLVLEQKCVAEQLNADYGKCYEDCQTNWCLYYDCANSCKPSVASVWTPPKPSRLLRRSP